MMSYIDVNWDFSQFDRDNAARHQAAGSIMNANVIAGRILDSPGRERARRLLERADDAVGDAEDAIAEHDYPEKPPRASRRSPTSATTRTCGSGSSTSSSTARTAGPASSGTTTCRRRTSRA